MHKKQKEDWGHVITLSDTNSVLDKATQIVKSEFDLEAIVKLLNDVDKLQLCSIFTEEGEEQIMVHGVTSFNQIHKKDISCVPIYANWLYIPHWWAKWLSC